MSEEQFWHSNPRKLNVWQMAHEEKIKEQNRLLHIQGYYNHIGVAIAIGQAFGKNFREKYPEEPLQLFEPTAAEKQAQYEKEHARYKAWVNSIKPRK